MRKADIQSAVLAVDIMWFLTDRGTFPSVDWLPDSFDTILAEREDGAKFTITVQPLNARAAGIPD